LRDARADVEKAMGLSFSIFMSGVFSRMIRDPEGSGYQSLLQFLDGGLLALIILLLAGSIVILALFRKRDSAWTSSSRHYYFMFGLLLVLTYASGYLIADAAIVAATLGVAANVLLASMTLGWKRYQRESSRTPSYYR